MPEPATVQLTRRPWTDLPGEGVGGRRREVGGPIALAGAVIHHPVGAAGLAAAERLRAALQQRGAAGVELAAAGWDGGTREPSDGRGTLADRVEPAHAPRTAVLLGNLSDNRHIADLYHCWLCPVDRSLPGRGGHYLRTHQDVYGDGGAVVVVGVSDEADLDAAVDRLLGHLDGRSGRDDGTDGPFLGHLHDTMLASGLWQAQPTLDPEHEVYADFRELARDAYRTRRHRGYTPYLTQLAEMFAVTGDPRFAQRYLDSFQDMVVDTAAWQPDQWGRWGFDADFQAARVISSWHAIADSAVFTEEDRDGIAGHLVAFLGNSEEQWRGHRDSPFPARHNHFTFASLGLLFGALLLGRVHRLPQRAEWVEMADECFTPMLAGGKASEDCEAYGWLTLAHTLRYALLRPVPAYVRDGQCATVLGRGVATMDNLAGQVPYGDASSHRGNFSEIPYWRPAAWLLADARYTPLLQRKDAAATKDHGVTAIASPLFGYDEPVGDADPGELHEHLGVTVLPLDDTYCRTHDDPVPERGFDKIAFRDGFDEQQPYLLVDGIDNGGHGHRDAGAIIRFTSRDRIWLEDAEYDKISANFHNTVLVARDGIVGVRPPYAELGEVADDGRVAVAQSVLRDYSGADWTRTVVQLRGVGFAVVDTVTAREPGEYEVTALWRTVGAAEDEADRWRVRMGDERLDIHTVALGPGRRRRRQISEPYVRFRSDWHSYPYAEDAESVLQDTTRVLLGVGESVRYVHLLADDPAESWLEPADDGTVVGAVGGRGFTVDPVSPMASTILDRGHDVSSRRRAGVRDEGAGSTTAEAPLSLGRSPEAEPTGQGAQWTVTAGTGPLAVVGAGDVLAVADGRRVALWRDGAEIVGWQAATEVSALGAGPEGTVVVGGHDGVVALYGLDGALLWQQEFPGHMGHQAIVNTIGTAELRPGELPTVLVGTESCHVHAYGADGTELWRYEVIHAAHGVAAADLDGDGCDEVYAISGYWSWHGIDAAGEQVFGVRGVESEGGDVVLTHAGLALFGGWDGHLTAYRPDGQRVWDLATGDMITAAVPVGEGDLLVASRSGRLYRVGPDGTLRWHRPLPVTSLVLGHDGPVAGVDDALVWLADDGSVRRRCVIGAPIAEVRSLVSAGADGVAVRDGTGTVHWVRGAD